MARISLREPSGGLRLDRRDVGGGLARRRRRQTAQARLPSLYDQPDRRSRRRWSPPPLGNRQPEFSRAASSPTARPSSNNPPRTGRFFSSRPRRACRTARRDLCAHGAARGRGRTISSLRDDLYCMSTARALLENMRRDPRPLRRGPDLQAQRNRSVARSIPAQQRQSAAQCAARADQGPGAGPRDDESRRGTRCDDRRSAWHARRETHSPRRQGPRARRFLRSEADRVVRKAA